jgi:hypothetical protein
MGSLYDQAERERQHSLSRNLAGEEKMASMDVMDPILQVDRIRHLNSRRRQDPLVSGELRSTILAAYNTYRDLIRL